MADNKKNIVCNAICVLCAVIYAAAFPVFLCIDAEQKLNYTNSIWPVIVAVVVYILARLAVKVIVTGRGIVTGGIYSLIVASCLIIGKDLAAFRHVDLMSARIVIGIVLAAVPIFYVTVYSWGIISGLKNNIKNRIQDTTGEIVKKIPEKRLPIIIFVSFLIAWLPSYLAEFPGNFFADNAIQYKEFLGGIVSRSFPIFHTYYVGILITIGKALFGSVNGGVAFAVFVQMCILSAVFTFTVMFFVKRKAGRTVSVVIWALYAFMPVMQLYCKDLCRDVLFCTFVVVLSFILFYSLNEPWKLQKTVWHIIVTALVMFFALNLRNIAIYVFIVVFAYVLIRTLIVRKKEFIITSSVMAVVIVAFFIWNNGVSDCISIENSQFEGIASSGSEQNMSVMLNQVSCVAARHWDELTDYDRETITEVFPEDIVRNYNDRNVDLVKYHFDAERYRSDKSKYNREWMSLGKRFKSEYANAFLNLNLQTWYPDTILDGYTFIDYYTIGISDPASFNGKIPWLHELQYKISREISFQRIPLIPMIFSPAIMIYIILYSLFFMIYSRNTKGVVLLVFDLVLHFGTLLCPVVTLRYTLISFMTMPIALGLIFTDLDNEYDKRES